MYIPSCNYAIVVYVNSTNCTIKYNMCYPNRVSIVLKILRTYHKDSDIIVYDKLGNRYTVEGWLNENINS